jgi:hypothetical protein
MLSPCSFASCDCGSHIMTVVSSKPASAPRKKKPAPSSTGNDKRDARGTMVRSLALYNRMPLQSRDRALQEVGLRPPRPCLWCRNWPGITTAPPDVVPQLLRLPEDRFRTIICRLAWRSGMFLLDPVRLRDWGVDQGGHFRLPPCQNGKHFLHTNGLLQVLRRGYV